MSIEEREPVFSPGEVTGFGILSAVLAADPGLHRLYVASESGVLSVYATGAGAVREIAHAKLADNAHSVAVDPATHLVYLPLTDGGYGVPVLRVMKPC